MARSDSITISVNWPVRGLQQTLARSVPIKDTTPDARNVWTYDRSSRAVGGPRDGISKVAVAGTNALGGGAFIQSIVQTFHYNGSVPAADLAVVEGGSIYTATNLGTVTLAGSNSLSNTAWPCAIPSGRGSVYYLDGGTNVVKLTLPNGTNAASVGDLTATAGSIPEDCTVGLVWRDRLVLAGPNQNWYASRSGCHTDFDYGAAGTDAARPIAGANMPSKVPDPINCLMSFEQDRLVFGCSRSMYACVGDPAEGGQIVQIARDIGTRGPRCWCTVNGVCYFVGTGGFYRMVPGGFPENLSAAMAPELFEAHQDTHWISVAYDPANVGLWIFQTPKVSGTPTHVWYDLRRNAFWPMAFPAAHGPTAVEVWDSSTPADRVVLIGGRDGYVRKIDDAARTDDGTAITSYVKIGPIQPAGDDADARLNGFRWTMGTIPSGFTASDWGGSYVWAVGRSAVEALEDPDQTATGSFDAEGRQTNIGLRLGGNSFVLTAQSDSGKLWSLEGVSARFDAAGRSR